MLASPPYHLRMDRTCTNNTHNRIQWTTPQWSRSHPHITAVMVGQGTSPNEFFILEQLSQMFFTTSQYHPTHPTWGGRTETLKKWCETRLPKQAHPPPHHHNKKNHLLNLYFIIPKTNHLIYIPFVRTPLRKKILKTRPFSTLLLALSVEATRHAYFFKNSQIKTAHTFKSPNRLLIFYYCLFVHSGAIICLYYLILSKKTLLKENN